MNSYARRLARACAIGTAAAGMVLAGLVSAVPAAAEETPLQSTFSLPVPKDALPREAYTATHHDYPAIDLPVPNGTPALAARPGTVELVNDSSCGLGAIINGDDGGRYIYCHLQEQSVGGGARVAAGDQIGLTNNTGNSTGPHLHFATKVGSTSHCPQEFLLAIYDGTPVPAISSLPTTGCTH